KSNLECTCSIFAILYNIIIYFYIAKILQEVFAKVTDFCKNLKKVNGPMGSMGAVVLSSRSKWAKRARLV
ncbi:MAG: hypothetical protein AB1404_08210, partial [Spirochaetota bacterium]